MYGTYETGIKTFTPFDKFTQFIVLFQQRSELCCSYISFSNDSLPVNLLSRLGQSVVYNFKSLMMVMLQWSGGRVEDNTEKKGL